MSDIKSFTVSFSIENKAIHIQKFSVELDFICIYGYNSTENKAIHIQKFSVEVQLWSLKEKFTLTNL